MNVIFSEICKYILCNIFWFVNEKKIMKTCFIELIVKQFIHCTALIKISIDIINMNIIYF